jgi:hypothetical protein
MASIATIGAVQSRLVYPVIRRCNVWNVQIRSMTTNNRHMLAAVRTMGAGLRRFEKSRNARVAAGEDVAEASRDAAQSALTLVVMFLQDYGYESASLTRLVADLAALEQGSKPSRMLSRRVVKHRSTASPTIETIKGRLAAIMEYRQGMGVGRLASRKWVFDCLSRAMREKLKINSGSAVDRWLVTWGGQYGTSSPGRSGYDAMRTLLEKHRPTERALKKAIKGLAKSLPA